jgi:hypothetical protein
MAGGLLVGRSATGAQVTPEAHRLRQRRTGYVPTQSGRTGPTTAGGASDQKKD